jgi:hypothetical protein
MASDAKMIRRRDFLVSASSCAGAVVLSNAVKAAIPCPPPQLSASGGTTASTQCASGSATPTLVQARATSTNTTQFISNPVTVTLPNATLAGNCLIVCVMSDTEISGAPSVADNLSSGIWGAPAVSSAGGQRLDVFVGLNCPAGITTLRITHAGTPTKTQYSAYEFCGVAPASALDGTSSGTTNAGTITTTAGSDLIFCYGAQVSGSAVSQWTAGSGFQLLNAQNLNSNNDPSAFAEFTVQSAAGSVTPTAGGASGTLQMVALALKASPNAGTPRPAGIRVVNVQGYNFYGSTQAAGPWRCQFPTRGNLVHLSVTWYPAAASGFTGLTGMSDTAGNTYTANCGPITSSDSQAGYMQNVRAQGGSASTSNVITFNADTLFDVSHVHVEFYDVIGAQSSSHDKTTTANGVQTSDDQQGGQHVLSTVSLTPSNANELIINVCGIDAHNLSGVYDASGLGYRSDIADCASFNGAGSGLETDCGFAHINVGTAAQTTFVYTVQNQGTGGITGVQGWASCSSAYK